MVVITAIFTFALALLNHVTADRIEFNAETKMKRTLLYVFDITPNGEDPSSILNTYNEFIVEEKINDETVYIAVKNDEVIGYAFEVDGNALWGSVRGLAAVSKDFSTLLGIDFVSHSETPGLGGRISEPWFKEQFRGLDLNTPKDNEYIIYNPSPGGNVDAISGATLTSVSIKNLLNQDIHSFLTTYKGGKLVGN